MQSSNNNKRQSFWKQIGKKLSETSNNTPRSSVSSMHNQLNSSTATLYKKNNFVRQVSNNESPLLKYSLSGFRHLAQKNQSRQIKLQVKKDNENIPLKQKSQKSKFYRNITTVDILFKDKLNRQNENSALDNLQQNFSKNQFQERQHQQRINQQRNIITILNLLKEVKQENDKLKKQTVQALHDQKIQFLTNLKNISHIYQTKIDELTTENEKLHSKNNSFTKHQSKQMSLSSESLKFNKLFNILSTMKSQTTKIKSERKSHSKSSNSHFDIEEKHHQSNGVQLTDLSNINNKQIQKFGVTGLKAKDKQNIKNEQKYKFSDLKKNIGQYINSKKLRY